MFSIHVYSKRSPIRTHYRRLDGFHHVRATHQKNAIYKSSKKARFFLIAKAEKIEEKKKEFKIVRVIYERNTVYQTATRVLSFTLLCSGLTSEARLHISMQNH